jgi:hypothetical protein
MNFQIQPYPLFFSSIERGEVLTGRVIGWSVPMTNESSGLQPVALFDQPDGTVSEPRYLDLDDERFWVGEDKVTVRG